MSQSVVLLPRTEKVPASRHPADISRAFLAEINYHTRIRLALEQRYGKQGVFTLPVSYVFGSPDPVMHQDLSVTVKSRDLYIPGAFGNEHSYPIYAQTHIAGDRLVVKKMHISTPASEFEVSVFTGSDGWTRVGPWHYTLPLDDAKKLGLLPDE